MPQVRAAHAHIHDVPRQELILAALTAGVAHRIDAAGIHGGHPALEREVIAPCLELSAAAPDLLDHVGNAPVTA